MENGNNAYTAKHSTETTVLSSLMLHGSEVKNKSRPRTMVRKTCACVIKRWDKLTVKKLFVYGVQQCKLQQRPHNKESAMRSSEPAAINER